MMSPYIPSVLQAPPRNSISTERALKQIKLLLEQADFPDNCGCTEDMRNASLDDVQTMLDAIKRED